MHKTVFLVLRADGAVRVAKRPRLAADEVAVAIRIAMPAGWGQVIQTIDVAMPDPPTAEDLGPVERKD